MYTERKLRSSWKKYLLVAVFGTSAGGCSVLHSVTMELVRGNLLIIIAACAPSRGRDTPCLVCAHCEAQLSPVVHRR